MYSHPHVLAASVLGRDIYYIDLKQQIKKQAILLNLLFIGLMRKTAFNRL
jgi:hypothetical protein